MFSFIRSYFLYIYYWLSKEVNKKTDGSPNLYKSFLEVELLFVGFLFGCLFLSFHYFPERAFDIYGKLQLALGRVETHKGTVSIAPVLIIIVISYTSTYFLCRFRISFEGIPVRLKRYNFLKTYSRWKVALPFVCIFVFWLSAGVVLSL